MATTTGSFPGHSKTQTRPTHRPPTSCRSMIRSALLATIDPAYTSGLPKVTFDVETTLSGKGYPYAYTYMPTANDRVLMPPQACTATSSSARSSVRTAEGDHHGVATVAARARLIWASTS